MTKRNLVMLIIIALVALLLDQVSKYLIVYFLKSPGHSVRVLGNFLVFVLTYNPKGVFGLNIAPGISYYILPFIGIILVIFFARTSQHRGFIVCYGMILGGAFGNLIDRVFRHGGVVDFAQFSLAPIGIKWPIVNPWFIFNVADSCLVIGIILLLIFETISARKPVPALKPQMNADEHGTEEPKPESKPPLNPDEHGQNDTR
jgi:signal peptidase II